MTLTSNEFSDKAVCKKILFLIGLPGVGKSFFGKKIAKTVGVPFYDLDEEIMRRTGQTIVQLFDAGEAFFRKKEASTLKTLLAEISKTGGFAVVASGGGTPCFKDNLTLMRSSGLLLYLKAAPAFVAQRIRTDKRTRPLLKDEQALEQKIAELLEARSAHYEEADATTTQLDTSALVAFAQTFFSKQTTRNTCTNQH